MALLKKPLPFKCLAYLENLLGRKFFTMFLAGSIDAALKVPPIRPILEKNLRRILQHTGADSSPAALESIITRNAKVYTEIMLSLIVFNDKEFTEKSKEVVLDLMPVLEGLFEKGSGVILVGPHFGHVNLAMLALAGARRLLHVVFLDAGPFEGSQAWGLRVIELGVGAADCLRALRNNDAVLLYTDVDFFPGGRTSDFFGAPIRPPHGPPRLALASGAPILPIYTLWREGRHHVLCDEPILPEGRTQEELESAILRSMESFIGKYPEQWWLYKDLWDIEAMDRANRRHLTLSRFIQQAARFGKALLPWGGS